MTTDRDPEPVPDPSTLMGLLHVLRKTHMELVGKDAAHQRFSEVSTRGDARQYIEELMSHFLAERTKRRQSDTTACLSTNAGPGT